MLQGVDAELLKRSVVPIRAEAPPAQVKGGETALLAAVRPFCVISKQTSWILGLSLNT